MVKITYSPYEEIVIHEILEQDNAMFFEDVVRQALASASHAEPSVNWIDGIAFIIHQFAPTEDLVKEHLSGRIHYSSVIFSRLDFQAQMQVKIGGQTFSVRLRKADTNPTLVELVRYLRGHAKTQVSGQS